MADQEQYLGYEAEEQSGYMKPHKYRLQLRCLRCGNEYHRVVSSLNAKNPPCPRRACKEAAIEEEVAKRVANERAIIENRQMPGIIGDKPMVKAVDKTAEIVMEDHKLTDLKDNIRMGESMAPKLPPAQQQAADNFFSAGKSMAGGNRRMTALGKRALAGAYRQSAVSPGDIFRAPQGASPFRPVKSD